MAVDVYPSNIIGSPTLASLYATGAACPVNQEFELYANTLDSTVVGNDIGNPPYTTLTNGPNTFVTQRQDFGGHPTCFMQKTTNNIGFAFRGKVWNQGYNAKQNFNNTICGVYIQAHIDDVFFNNGSTTSAVFGLVIGAEGINGVNKFNWNVIANTAGSGANGDYGFAQTTYGSYTGLVGSVTKAVAGDTVKMKVSMNGAYGWRLELFINGVVQATLLAANDSRFFLSGNTAPTSVGFYVCSASLAAFPGLDFVKVSDFRIGVC